MCLLESQKLFIRAVAVRKYCVQVAVSLTKRTVPGLCVSSRVKVLSSVPSSGKTTVIVSEYFILQICAHTVCLCHSAIAYHLCAIAGYKTLYFIGVDAHIIIYIVIVIVIVIILSVYGLLKTYDHILIHLCILLVYRTHQCIRCTPLFNGKKSHLRCDLYTGF